ncbi:Peroxisomal membrane protein PMP30B [Turnera subulata]|uniref:Peroxisomal membrane protein PMP30B n=1 Tax=Turnera subulata TaxID=218843 RepID=A0A9Q0JLL4_9ROSI|nr:Peroxisomal membrane protein PMP30B [Turnera subulata]
MNDKADKLVIFLAKRDGIDKLVKTFQYVSKLVHWHTEAGHPEVAQRFKQWEVASGLSRKAFRTGRFLTGFNALRRGPGSTPTFRSLAVLANAGEMVYFFFDHLLWLSRIGTLDAKLAKRMSFISAFGESFGYVFFIIADVIVMRQGLQAERRQLANISSQEGQEDDEDAKESIRKIRADRIMRLMAVAANVADLIIALAEIQPNPFCNHALTLGISGLVSAWAGWIFNMEEMEKKESYKGMKSPDNGTFEISSGRMPLTPISSFIHDLSSKSPKEQYLEVGGHELTPPRQ